MKSIYKLFAQLFALSYTFCMAVWWCIVWWMAYLGGSASVLVTINEYNEMMIELGAWFILIPVVCYGFYLNYVEIFYG